MRDVVAAVAERTGTTLIELQSARRHRHLAQVRCVTAHLLRRLTRASMPMIGRLLHRDHTTILHALARVEAVMQAEPSLAQLVDEVMALYPPIEIVEESEEESETADPVQQLIAALEERIAALEERLKRLEQRQAVEGMPSAHLPSPPAPPPPSSPPEPPPPPPTRPRPTPFVHRPRVTPAEAMERARQTLEQSLYSPRERAARLAFDHAAKALAAQQTGA